MQPPRLRKPRFQRAEQCSPLVLTERDVGILALVNHYRFITSDHLVRLTPGSVQHLTRRLGRLFHAGYLERPRAQCQLTKSFNSHLVYCLTRTGQAELRHRGIAAFASMPRFRASAAALSLSHSLRITDIVAAFETSASRRAWRFIPHHQWNQRTKVTRLRHLRWFLRFTHHGINIKTSVIPDAAFALESPSGERSYFLLEVDRGTMPVLRSDFRQSSFFRKVIAYKETRRTGILWKRFQILGFRVLMVAESTKRLASLQAATVGCFHRGESSMFLFAAVLELLSGPDVFEHLWQTCSGKKQSLTA